MSLDQNLFTLNITQRAAAPHILELIDPQENVHYRKERVDGPTYAFHVFDPLSDSLLASVTAPASTSKHKTIELHNPSVPVELKYTGTFTFRWTFLWEDHEFEWKREECFLIRKPDPPVLVAVTKEPPGKIKTRAVQILDYNLNRFDIQDRKGLEIVLLSALLSFQDYSEGKREENSSSSSQSQVPVVVANKTPEREALPPAPPPKLQKTGAEKIADMQKGQLNEILVVEEGEVDDYAEYCSNLLEGDTVLFVVLRSSLPETVPKVLQIVHQTKRIRHKSGSDDELHQYVQYDADTPMSLAGKKTPRVIKLDDDANKNKYKPPESLTVHLSKIPMPELQPKAKGKAPGKEKENDHVGEKERKRLEKEEEKERREREKREKKDKDKRKDKANPSGRNDAPVHSPRPALGAEGNRLSKRSSPPNVSSHRIHPHQPSPSPSQLNTPSSYASPSPPHIPPRPSPSPHPMPGSYPGYPTHAPSQQRPGPSPGPVFPQPNAHPYPNTLYGSGPYAPQQRPVSAYGGSQGPAPPFAGGAGERPTATASLVNGFLEKLKMR